MQCKLTSYTIQPATRTQPHQLESTSHWDSWSPHRVYPGHPPWPGTHWLSGRCVRLGGAPGQLSGRCASRARDTAHTPPPSLAPLSLPDAGDHLQQTRYQAISHCTDAITTQVPGYQPLHRCYNIYYTTTCTTTAVATSTTTTTCRLMKIFPFL